MKILRLRFTNLNSLRGSHAIDFTLPPLAQAGLFAITGPTGAGKTTILDAITLALYGRAARYEKTPSPEAVLSRHCGECGAEVEFACAAGEFRSVWQLQRARKKPDGKFQPPKRRVVALPAGEVIAESIKDADAKILELTGLDYDRFLRSVLLAQGEFAAFLKAEPKDRMDLLQQVTGTEIYQDISRAAFERCRAAQEAHARLLCDHQALVVLDAGQRAQHEAGLAERTRRVEELNALLKTLATRIADAQRWLEIEQAGRQLAADQTQHATEQRAFEPERARLAQHERAAPFVVDLSALDRLAAEQARDITAIATLDARLPELARSLAAADEAAQQAQRAVATEEERLPQRRALWADVTELDRVLATANETLRQQTEQQAAIEQNVATLTSSVAGARAELQALAKNESEATRWLEAHASDALLAAKLPEVLAGFERWIAAENAVGTAQQTVARHQKEFDRLQLALRSLEEKTIPLQREVTNKAADIAVALARLERAAGGLPLTELEVRRDQARERRVVLEKLAADAGRLRTLSAEIGARQMEVARTADASTRLAGERDTQQRRCEDLGKVRDARRQTLGYAEKVQSLQSHRATLQDHAPCPLCGALDHPYVTAGNTPADELAALRDELAAAETELKKAQGRLTEAEKQHAAQVAHQKAIVAELARLTAEQAALKTAWATAAAASGVTDPFEAEPAIAAALAAAQSEETARAAQLTAVREAEQALQKVRVELQAAEKAVDEARSEMAKQTALIAQVKEQRALGESVLVGNRQSAAGERAALTHRVAGFATIPENVEAATKLPAELKARAATFTQRQTNAQTLRAEMSAQQVKLDGLGQQLADATTAAAEMREKVAAAKAVVDERASARREKFGDRTVAADQAGTEARLTQLRGAADAKRGEVEKSRQTHVTATQEKARLAQVTVTRAAEREALEGRLHAAANAAGFADVAGVRAALAPADEANALGRRRKTLDDRGVVLATHAAALAAQRKALPEAASGDALQLAALQTEQTNGETERATAQASIGELRATLKADDDQRARQAAFAGQIENAHREYARWDRLRALIGSSDGSVFARFAQGLTLERLTALANRHLAQLNPRYSIRREKEGEAGDLELEIVDHYQADVTRPMRSLSGGESFLVSLALALGLSELASGRTSIESLFIDEGFGSLDADTLELAMAALENLQAGGKTIGVISHVPAMQERIPAQIKVVKESAGCSRVTIAS